MYSPLLLICRESPVYKGPYWFGAIQDSCKNIVACGIHNLPDGLCISEMPRSMIAAVHDSIADSVGIPHRIVAPQRTAVLLAEQFSAKDSAPIRFDSRWLTYRLDKANVRVRGVEGQLRSGRREEEDLIAEWGRAFAYEDGTPFDVAEFMLRKRSDGDLYIWDHDGPKSIVTLSGPAGEGIRISGVYTPPQFRCRGYASAAVAQVGQTALTNGRKFVVLNVIEGRPAVRIYQQLGYRLIGSKDCYLIDN